MKLVLKRIVQWSLAAVAAVMLALCFAGWVPDTPYLLDYAAQLRVLHFIAVIPLLLCAALVRSKVAVVLSLCAVVFDIGLCFLPYHLPNSVIAAQHSPSIKVVASNIEGAHNKNFLAFTKFVRDENPDVLMISEFSPDWYQELKKRLPDYSFESHEPCSGGTAMMSRLPIRFVNVGTRPRRYGIRGVVQLGDTDLMLIASHPPAPCVRKKFELRNAELQRLAVDTRESKIPIILAGDLNTTPWSFHFQRLLREGNLQDSEMAHGIQPTYNAKHLFPVVPIDHCLYSSSLVLLDRHVGPALGADHLPVVATLRLREAPVGRRRSADPTISFLHQR